MIVYGCVCVCVFYACLSRRLEGESVQSADGMSGVGHGHLEKKKKTPKPQQQWDEVQLLFKVYGAVGARCVRCGDADRGGCREVSQENGEMWAE